MSDDQSSQVMGPARTIPGDDTKPQPQGTALCLSGGGYRAMLFHVGSLWRLNEAGLLPKLDRISSVSGGSIIAGVLGMNWSQLRFVSNVAQDFYQFVVDPCRTLASHTIDTASVIKGALLPGSIADRVAKSYRELLFDNKTLQDLPDKPFFVINSTNVQSKVLWRFTKRFMADYRVGLVPNPTIELAVAVAASSAFPPFLSPLELNLKASQYTPDSGMDLQYAPFTTKVVLTDGGVYDNLGLETAWKNCETILISDGGGMADDQADPKRDWIDHSYRILSIIDNQVRSLRKRQAVDSFISGQRKGTYWGTRTNIADYKLATPLPCPHDKTLDIANIPTRLKSMSARDQERLINWGYAVTDAALRAHVDGTIPRGQFPYPPIGVG